MRRAGLVAFALALAVAAPALGRHASAHAPVASAVTITAAPNPVVFGASTTIAGQATGKKATGATVDLEAQPAPFTGPFSRTASTTTDATGHYSFRVVPGLNTLYKVIVHTAPSATSANLLVKVRVRVTLGVSTSRPAIGQRVRFRGLVLPAYNGKLVRIQHRTRRGWVTIARATLTAATPAGGVARSQYGKRVRITVGGAYRVFFDPADHLRLPNASRTVTLTVH